MTRLRIVASVAVMVGLLLPSSAFAGKPFTDAAADFEARVEFLEAEVASLTSDLAAQQSQIDDLVADLADLEARVAALEGPAALTPSDNVQAALDGTEDQFLLTAGSYPALTLRRPGVTITAEDGAVIDGLTLDGADGAVLDGLDLSGAVIGLLVKSSSDILVTDVRSYGNATGIRFEGAGVSGVVDGGEIFDNTAMVRNDSTPGNDYGAMGIDFHDTSLPITVRNLEVRGNRVSASAPSIDYGLNEGAAFECWQSTGMVIERNRVWDNQVVLETGRNSGECSFTFKHNVVWNGKTDSSRLSKGLLIRTGTGSLVEHNVFDRMDHWAISVTGGGGFGGSVDGLQIRDNIAVTPAALCQIGSPSGSWSHDYNLAFTVWGSCGTEAHGVSGDPLFVDVGARDYHLQAGSPAIGAAHDGSDIGAY